MMIIIQTKVVVSYFYARCTTDMYKFNTPDSIHMHSAFSLKVPVYT